MSEHPQGQKHCSFCGKTQSEVGKLIEPVNKLIRVIGLLSHYQNRMRSVLP